MLGAEPAPAPPRAGLVPDLVREITKDPAMLLWLSGTQNTKCVAERELRARADGALHPRRGQRLHRAGRARAGARAHRAGRTSGAVASARPTSVSTAKLHDEGSKRIFGKRGRVRLAGRRAALPRARPPSRLLRRQALGLLRADAAGLEDPRRAGRACTRKHGDMRPIVDAILRHPALYTGPRMVKPPVVYTAGLLRALGRGIDTDSWAWLSEHDRPAPLHAAERRRLGRRAAGSTPRPSGAAGGSRTTRRSRTH